ncbi:MAG: hypothetical protein U0610_14870 [bacterium]
MTARRIARVIRNVVAAGVMLAVAAPATFLLYAALGGPATTAIVVATVVALHLRTRWLPGEPLTTSLRYFLDRPLIGGNPRLGILLLAMLSVGFTVLGLGYLPAGIAPAGTDGLIVDRILSGNTTLRFGKAPGDPLLVVLHGHIGQSDLGTPGLSLIDLATEPPRVRFVPRPTSKPESATILPDRGVVVVHESGGPDSVQSVSLFIDPVTLESRERVEEGFDRESWFERRFMVQAVFKSVYDPSTSQLYIVNRNKSEILAVPVDEFLAEGLGRARHYSVPEVPILEEAFLDPHNPRRLFCRGEFYARFMAELDLDTGARRTIGVPPWHWGFTLDPTRPRIYLARGAANALSVIDRDRHEVVANLLTPGLPRSVEFVAPLDLIAVGTYQGWKLLLLDARTFETLARVPTCDLVRGLVFDDVTQALYVGDGCGVLRIRFTEGWRARRADP